MDSSNRPRSPCLVTAGSGARKAAQPKRRSAPSSLGEEEAPGYSDRFLDGYDRLKLLGRGACAVVWLARRRGQSTYVAVKQVAKGNTGKHRADMKSACKEVAVGNMLFHPGGEPKVSMSTFPGVGHIARLFDSYETRKDIWLVLEFGGTSLTKLAYDIKGETIGGSRMYRVHHLAVIQAMKRDSLVFKRIMAQLLSALHVLQEHRVVHSDIKPDNILLEEDHAGQLKARLIDLGSAYVFEDPENIPMATPEYMPPEALESCATRMSGASRQVSRRSTLDDRLPVQCQPWSFDMWSLGSIMLEISLGTPLWLSYKCRAGDSQRTGTGLFAVPGRDPERIIQRQVEALQERGLMHILRDPAGVILSDAGLGLLAGMLMWDPLDRLSPDEALDHPWFCKEDEYS